MPEIYGWNRMPIWAKALAAPAYADQLAFTPLKSLFGAIDAGANLYGNYNGQDYVKKLAEMGDPNAVLNAPIPYVGDAAKTQALIDARQKRANDLYSQAPEVTGFSKKLSDMIATGNGFDPNFTGKEWVRGMTATTPEEEALYDAQTGAIPTKGGVQTTKGNNPILAALIQKAEVNAQEQADTAKVADATFKGVAPDTNTLTRFLTSGKGQMVTGEKGTGGSSLYDKIMGGAKQTREVSDQRAAQDTINSVGMLLQNPDFIKGDYNHQVGQIMQNTGISDPAKIDQILKTANIIKEMKSVDTGVNGTETKQTVMYDPRTVKEGQIGANYIPSAPKVSVSNYMPAQETAFAKGVGEANAKQYADAVDQKAKSEKAIQTIDDYLNASKNTWSGLAANASYLAAKANPVKTETQKQAIVNYETAIAKSKEMAMDILTNFKGQISDGERKFATEMANNPKMDRGSQQRLADLAKRNHQTQIRKADTLIKAVENEPVRSNINKTLQDNKRPPLSSFRR